MSEMLRQLEGLDIHSCVVTSDKHPFSASMEDVLSRKKVMEIVKNGVAKYEQQITVLTQRVQELTAERALSNTTKIEDAAVEAESDIFELIKLKIKETDRFHDRIVNLGEAFMAIDAIKEAYAKTKKNDGWIPCGTRLPATYETVQVTYLGFDDRQPYSNGSTAFIDETGAWNWTKGSHPVTVPIVAWRENLPPYQPEIKVSEDETCSEADIRNNAFDDLLHKIQSSSEREYDYEKGECIGVGDIEYIVEDLKKTGENNNGWILCSDKLPENEEKVEITYIKKDSKSGKNKYLTARAFYTTGDICTLDSKYDWHDTDNWERIECEEDAYAIPEGWWECVDFAESFAPVDMPVIAWRPLQIPFDPTMNRGGK